MFSLVSGIFNKVPSFTHFGMKKLLIAFGDIILGRPFLRTIGAIIDGNVKFQFPHKKCMEHFPRKRDTPKFKLQIGRAHV